MKTKTKKRLIICLAIIVLLLAIVYGAYRVAMNYAGDKAMDMLVTNQINNMLDSGEVTLSDLEEIIAEPSQEAPAESEEPAPDSPSANTEPTQKEPQQSTRKEKQPTTKTRSEVVKAASNKVQESVARSDKDEMMKLITSRLSASDVSYLLGLLSGGLTSEEWYEAKKLCLSRFSGEELDRVVTLYHRYRSNVPFAKSSK